MDVHKEIASVVGLLQSLVGIAQHDGHPCALMDAAKVAEDAVWSALKRVENRRSQFVVAENADRAPAYLLLLNIEGVLSTALAACYSLRHEGEADAGLATVGPSSAITNEVSSYDARVELKKVITELRVLEQRTPEFPGGDSIGPGRRPLEIPQDIIDALERAGFPPGLPELKKVVRSVQPGISDREIVSIQKRLKRRREKGQDPRTGRSLDS